MLVSNALDAALAATSAQAGRAATAMLHNAPDVRVVVFRIAPGQDVPVHTSTSSVVLTVLEGSGTVSGRDGERQVRAADLIAYAPNESHGMRAGAETFVLLAVIAPAPGSRAG
jgi:quercetin dioxygenase-like cupin family protein